VSPPEVLDEGEPVAGDEPAGMHRKLYETALRQLAPDERAARAKAAEEPELSALCFDPLPAVIHALLDNPRFGLPQARLVAAHHRTASGLEALAARAALAADACPPALIAHLMKQELVRRSPALKLLLQRYPNAPAEPRR